MSDTPENFDKLTRLLTLKRHEQPPPGYYDRLSREIIGSLRQQKEDAGRSWFGGEDMEATWTQRFWRLLESKPALSGVFGVAVAGLLLGSIVYSQQMTQPYSVADTTSPQDQSPFANAAVTVAAAAQPDPSVFSSTNPVVDPLGPQGLFDGVRLRPQTTPVNWSVGGN